MPERKRVILARNGFQTYATTLNLAKSENIKSVASKENLPIHIEQLDVIDDKSVTTAIQAIVPKTDRKMC
jgi:hypothetical protein